jgi:hypothetical protein
MLNLLGCIRGDELREVFGEGERALASILRAGAMPRLLG